MEKIVELVGSFRAEPEAASVLGPVAAEASISLTLHLKPSAAPEPFESFARRHGLAIRHDPSRRSIFLDGAHASMARAFGTSLRMYNDGMHRFRARSGPLKVPEALAAGTLAALGFDHRPVVRHRQLSPLASPADGPGLWPSEIGSLYGLDPALDAPGECIGIIALGGGYLPADLAAAAKGMERREPFVVDCPVNGVTNLFGGGLPFDEELALDLQVVAGLVPSARIAVYFAENNSRSLADAIRQAVNDDVNRPHVISISWGSAERFWTAAARDAMQSAFSDAVKSGISVVAAAGDQLATAGVPDSAAHVLFPASSPFALACGGTQLVLDDSGALKSETVWHDGLIGGGGGISDLFEMPDYQKAAGLPKSFNDGAVRRGVPDVAAAAARTPGYRIVLNGQPRAMQGTSAAAPLWASLIAMANAKRGFPVGLIHSYLYASPSICRPIVAPGDNRLDGIGYDAGPGWNACTGLGVPNRTTVDGIANIPANPRAQEPPHVT